MKPGYQRANLDEETADWRAVCGRTACTVRREGRGIPSLPLSRIQRPMGFRRSCTSASFQLILRFRASQGRQGKAQPAGNSELLSRAVTQPWRPWLAPSGRGEKCTSAALRKLDIVHYVCPCAPCICTLFASLNPQNKVERGTRSLSDLGVRREGKRDRDQNLCKFEANSGLFNEDLRKFWPISAFPQQNHPKSDRLLGMEPADGDTYEPLLGYIILEQAQATVDMSTHRLLHVRKVDVKQCKTDTTPPY
uniref:Uncharacterized protein n=1 Tax=Candidatus Kentrum sp. DK TaxID=2126562 RepID=A0A450S5M8_9GAMM|nr:MAG: hypothetical protein BECKDK2373B_GA0170837_10161 [Candidatus Kentron sp. DK]